MQPGEAMNLKRSEVLSIIAGAAICSLLGCVGLKQQSRSRTVSNRLVCVDNLKQIGLATRIWSNDSTDDFPMARSSRFGGSREWLEAGEVWKHYSTLSNTVDSAAMLACPDDTNVAARSWASLSGNSQVSYFVGLDAGTIYPNTLLSGDRNVAMNGKWLTGVVALGTNSPVQWTANELHRGEGNIGYADGSVQQFTNEKLRAALVNSGDSNNRLVFP